MLTRIFSTPAEPKIVSRSTAWACLMTNLLVLPGIGTVTAGKKSGYVQALVAMTGFFMTGFWCAQICLAWAREGAPPTSLGPDFWICLIGIGLFAFGWTWSLISSVRIIRESAKNPPRL